MLLKKYYIFEKEKHFMMETFNYPEESLPLTSKGSPIGCKPNENHPHSHGSCICPTDYYRPDVNDDCITCPPNSRSTPMGTNDIGIDKCICNLGFTKNDDNTECRPCDSVKEIPRSPGVCDPIPNGHFIYTDINTGIIKHGYCELSFYHNTDINGYAEYRFTSKGYGNRCDDRPNTADTADVKRYYGAAREFVGLHEDRRAKLVAKAENGTDLPAGPLQEPCRITVKKTLTGTACPHTYPWTHVTASANPAHGWEHLFDTVQSIEWGDKLSDR